MYSGCLNQLLAAFLGGAKLLVVQGDQSLAADGLQPTGRLRGPFAGAAGRGGQPQGAYHEPQAWPERSRGYPLYPRLGQNRLLPYPTLSLSSLYGGQDQLTSPAW